MDWPLPEDLMPSEEVAYLNMKSGVARTILNTQVRVEEQRMKRKAADFLPKLLERVEQERKRRLLEEK